MYHIRIEENGFATWTLAQLSIGYCLYDGKGTLEEGETAEAQFIKIQAAYELLMDVEKRRQYDLDNRVNPMKDFFSSFFVQLYCFEDRGNRRVALRPELTPSLARLVIQKGKSVSLPLKWFAVGQCWRYERMTRGRRREHYQWNMDIIGVPDVIAEAELISSIVTFFKRIGITTSDVGFKISSRKVLQDVLQCYSIPDNLFGKVCIIIDKMEKIPIDEIKKELRSAELSDEAIEELLQVLSIKSLTKLEEKLGAAGEAEVNSLRLSNRQISLLLYSVWAQSISPANMLGNYEVIAHTYNLVLLFSHEYYLDCESFIYVHKVLRMVKNGVSTVAIQEWIKFGDIGQFELHLNESEEGATLFTLSAQPVLISEVVEAQQGDREVELIRRYSGRYDRLLSTFGGDDIPACGFGFGDAVIIELLKEKGLIPEIGEQVENIVCHLDPDLQDASAAVATILREKGQSVDLVLENKPLKWVFKRAARINARRLVLVGSSEWQKGMVSVKILSSGEQYEIEVDKLE
ncbi:histidine--tRNA ligase, chloroplastic/mitochondrial-like [Camellia sinensis]|uniref:histidine--tRNA ligase, chloroplastic/mitochondrial-like n=1 Tax=Camellia sinensis TaxID=4442 RepID=UPI0010356720|nr:histidine--tRNA ligase, chloroplastic/mitochondrial-like [Camellia sinensis]